MKVSQATAPLVEGLWQYQSVVNTRPHVMILGGVHGNELSGIQTIKSLRTKMESTTMLERGTVTLALGNIKAIAQNTRGSEPLSDLNRCFTPAILSNISNSNPYEHHRAQALAPFLAVGILST